MLTRYDSNVCSIKTELHDGQSGGFVWLFNTTVLGEGFTAELFEVPPTISLLKVGQVFEVASADVIDWMINDHGTLYGGFSLRYHRESLSPDERTAFDEYIGVTKYS